MSNVSSRRCRWSAQAERTLVLLLLLVPAGAFAASGDLKVNFSSSVVATWTGKTLGIALSFLPFLFLVSLMAEGAKPAGEPRNFAAVVQRLIVIFALLKLYGPIFSNLATMVQGAADSIAPKEIWQQLQTKTEEFLAAKAQYAQQNAAGTSGGDYALAEMANIADTIGGQLIDSVVTLIVLCGQAAFRIVGTLGGVLSMLLYVLGPLAIAASMPRSSDTGTKWLRVFVSVLSWPLISAVLVGLLTNYALDALKPNQPYEAAYASIALAGLLTVTAFAVPAVASALTGAGMGAVGAGWSSMGAWVGAAASGAGAAASTAGAMAGVGQKPAIQAANGVASAASSVGGGLQSSAATDGPVESPRDGFGARAERRMEDAAVRVDRATLGSHAPVAQGGGSPASPGPQQQQPPPFVESRQASGVAALAHATLPSPANLARNERLDANVKSPGGGGGLQPAPASERPAALPKKYAQAIENWMQANPKADLNDPRSRQEILQEHARLHSGAQGIQRGGGEPVTQRVLPQSPKPPVPSSTPTKFAKR